VTVRDGPDSSTCPKQRCAQCFARSVDCDDGLLVHAVGDRTVEVFLSAMESEAKRVSRVYPYPN
jgi:predicted amidohydrolase YtcJ